VLGAPKEFSSKQAFINNKQLEQEYENRSFDLKKNGVQLLSLSFF
jgi:hypothetical protein